MQTRGLAKRMSDDPPAIRLLFEHKATDQDTGSDSSAACSDIA